MSKFLNTSKSISEIESIVKDLSSTVVLISPYIKLTDKLKDYLVYRNNHKVPTIVIYGKKDLKDEQYEFFSKLEHFRLLFNSNLHAKCYVNDNKVVITSLNLYDFSMLNNIEYGVLLTKEDDKKAFNETFEEIRYLIESSLEEDISDFNVDNLLDDDDYDEKLLSISALAKENFISSKELFSFFEYKKFIQKGNNHWNITNKGLKVGGKILKSKYGEYPAFPESILIDFDDEFENFID